MSVSCLLLSAIELVAPAQDATVALISDGQRAVLTNETLAAREAVFAADRKAGKKIRHDAYWRKSLPVAFHCIGGSDRTGALAYVLNGVLGVSRQELETDWESTFYPNIPDQCHPNEPDFWCRESHFNDGFSKYGDANTTWNDRIVLYLKDCGITDAEIETFRKIML